MMPLKVDIGAAGATTSRGFAPGLAAPSADDGTIPPTGTGLYYLVAMKNACGEGSLGVGTSGGQVPNPLPCP